MYLPHGSRARGRSEGDHSSCLKLLCADPPSQSSGMCFQTETARTEFRRCSEEVRSRSTLDFHTKFGLLDHRTTIEILHRTAVITYAEARHLDCTDPVF